MMVKFLCLVCLRYLIWVSSMLVLVMMDWFGLNIRVRLWLCRCLWMVWM